MFTHALLTFLVLLLPFQVLHAGPEHTQKKTLLVDGIEREYLVHTPPAYTPDTPVPLILAFHGGEGTPERFEKAMRFSSLSDENGFIVIYPKAIDGHWNDGRESKLFADHDKKIDDVKFAMAVYWTMRSTFSIDTTRVFAVGVSNGGMFVQRLAIEHAELFAGIASVISSIPEPLKERFHPKAPVSVLFINGTADPFVPYEGGAVNFDLFSKLSVLRRKPDRGRVLSTDEAVKLWIAHNGTNSTWLRAKVPDHEPRDGATTDMFIWSGGQRETYVTLYKVIGGGHTIPGGSVGIPNRKLFGNICTDFDASAAIWLFFKFNARK